MIYDSGKPKYSEKNLFQCHLVHHKSHLDWPRTIPGPPRREAAAGSVDEHFTRVPREIKTIACCKACIKTWFRRNVKLIRDFWYDVFYLERQWDELNKLQLSTSDWWHRLRISLLEIHFTKLSCQATERHLSGRLVPKQRNRHRTRLRAGRSAARIQTGDRDFSYLHSPSQTKGIGRPSQGWSSRGVMLTTPI